MELVSDATWTLTSTIEEERLFESPGSASRYNHPRQAYALPFIPYDVHLQFVR